jgi:hypothetical protein
MNCPICNNILITEMVKLSATEFEYKYCLGNSKHYYVRLERSYKSSPNNLLYNEAIYFNKSRPIFAIWDSLTKNWGSFHTSMCILTNKKLDLNNAINARCIFESNTLSANENRLKFNYFDPDFNNYPRLLDKINVLINF